jgi:sugar phosphate isomerase/epimerase
VVSTRISQMSLHDRIGFDAGSTRLEDALQTAISNRFYYLDFNADIGPNRLDSWGRSRVRAIRNTCESNNIYLSLHTLSAVNIAEFSPFVDKAVDQYLEGNIDLARELGCQGAVVHAGYHFSGALDARKSASLERLKRAAGYAEKAGVTLLLENLNFEPDDAEVHYMAHTVEECRYYFDAISSERFGWAFTVNHANLVPEGINGFLDAFGVQRIGEVRLADNLGDKEIHMLPGEGNIDFEAAFRRLETSGFKKFYSMAFGSLDDRIKARETFASYEI